MDKLQKEVNELREQRNQHKQLADSNARQRDMFKALLTQSTGFSLPPQGDPKSYPCCEHDGVNVVHRIMRRFICSGLEASLQPAHIRPSVPATRSTVQRAATPESAQTAQAKAALKQVCACVHTQTPAASFVKSIK